jgi:hypothetical protein
VWFGDSRDFDFDFDFDASRGRRHVVPTISV